MKVFLTGATGFLGGELLVTLSKRTEIHKIYCFIRAASQEAALLKIESIFSLHEDYYDRNKIIPVLGNLRDELLTESLINNLPLREVNVIIHSAANTSFSRIYNKLVEEVNIAGLEKILMWAKTLVHLQTFLYIGTATICGKNIRDRLVKEEESPNQEAEHLVRYTTPKCKASYCLKSTCPRT